MINKLFHDKQIILGITGGISAYKTAIICSRLVQAGAIVEVVMTTAAQKFITPLTFQALTHRPVRSELFDFGSENIPHIALADAADLLIIAPTTANTIAKLANGLADNLLTAIALATPAPILLAPAMETDMWQHPITQSNVKKLVQLAGSGEREGRITFIGPAAGRLASGAIGAGRMVEPDEVIGMAGLILAKHGDLVGWEIVVTAGGTRESIDPVRFVSNHSSGKMGYAVATVARDRGANVTLITTASLPDPFGMKIIHLDSAAQLAEAVLKATPQADVLVMAAAVADFRPKTVAEQKIKKQSQHEELTLEMVRTPDILSEVAKQKAITNRPRIIVGFAAETENLLANATLKLRQKNLNFIVANDVTAPDAGFAVDTNRVTLLFADGSVEKLPLMSKLAVAEIILDKIRTFAKLLKMESLVL